TKEIGSRDLISRATAAKLLAVSPKTVQRAKVIKLKGSPELIAAVKAGEVPVKRGAELVKLATGKPNAKCSARNAPPSVPAIPTPRPADVTEDLDPWPVEPIDVLAMFGHCADEIATVTPTEMCAALTADDRAVLKERLAAIIAWCDALLALIASSIEADTA